MLIDIPVGFSIVEQTEIVKTYPDVRAFIKQNKFKLVKTKK